MISTGSSTKTILQRYLSPSVQRYQFRLDMFDSWFNIWVYTIPYLEVSLLDNTISKLKIFILTWITKKA